MQKFCERCKRFWKPKLENPKACGKCESKIWMMNNREKKKYLSNILSNTKIGEKNPMWKGDKVRYGSLHDWVKWWVKKPNKCDECKMVKRLDLANISQEYKRDLSDWEWLCRKCHMSKDGRLKFFMEELRGCNSPKKEIIKMRVKSEVDASSRKDKH